VYSVYWYFCLGTLWRWYR